jgi:hypothetical protein
MKRAGPSLAISLAAEIARKTGRIALGLNCPDVLAYVERNRLEGADLKRCVGEVEFAISGSKIASAGVA